MVFIFGENVGKKQIILNGKKVTFPIFYPSISSVKTNYSPSNYVDFLEYFGYPNYLVSAFDIWNTKHRIKMQDNIDVMKNRSKASIVMLDSGNYEAYWLNNREWNYQKYLDIIDSIEADITFSYDDPWNKDEYQTRLLELIEKPGLFVPILHSSHDNLLNNFLKISELHDWSIVAIPERELGDGIIQRANTLSDIREELEKRDIKTSIHLLGTGNPISLLIYSACGANSFDGLEWCQTVVNPENSLLLHFSQRDLFKCDCPACTAHEESFSATTLGHNLLFYMDWMKKIGTSLDENNIQKLIKSYIDGHVRNKIHWR